MNNIIRIYEKNETSFAHNGIKTLYPTSCTITRNLHDYTYELDMEHPIDDSNTWKEIIEGRIIKANGQYFRIFYTSTSIIDNSLTVYAKHIFFDLQNNFIEDTNVVAKNGNMALSQLLSATSFVHNFTSYSDISNINNLRCVRKNVLDALLGENESFISRWGGEFDADNFNIKIVSQIGDDNGYNILYGKNLTGLKSEIDYTEIVTRIRPIGFDGIELPDDNKYVDSPNIDNYAMPIIKEYKYENVKWTGSPNYEANEEDDTSNVFDDLSLAQAELRRLASLEFTENEVDLPKVSCEINFVELSYTEEYSQFKNLQKISLGDIVTFYHKPLDINIKARCISYVYDCILGKYESITIGSYQKNFFKETASTNKKIEDNDFDFTEQFQSVYAQAISKMSNMMNNAMNGYVVLSNSEILIMDSPDKNSAKNVWKFNSSGIAHSSTGYEGEYTVGMTMDGHINGALITAGTIKGDMLEVGTITTRELAVEIQTTINSAMTQETTQALITANLNQFESNLSQTFITEEKATEQIQTATKVAVEQATQKIVNTSVEQAMESVNDQLDNKLSDYTTNTMNPALQQAMQETLQDSKNYVVEVTGNYYTKTETDSKISQTRESIELGVSSTYETKENTSIKITEAIDGVTVGAVNRVFGTAKEKTKTFTGISNEVWNVYDISSDISDKDVIISFEYDLNVTVENGSKLMFQPYYLSTSNQATYYPSVSIIDSTSTQTINIKNQQFSFTTKFNGVQQDCTFRFRADGVIGTFTIRKAQIKVGNKITEWSIAPEDIETNANNYTIQQLASYYTKEQTESKISALQDSINLRVSNVEENVAEIQTSVEEGLGVKLTNYYTKEETNAEIELAKKSITSTISNTYATKLDIENISIGGENLIINSNFDYGFTNWTGDTSSYSITQDNKLFFNHSEYTSTQNKQVYTKPIDVSQLVGREVTVSFDYCIVDKSLWSSIINIGYIRFFDDETKTTQADSLGYKNLSFPSDYKNNTWQRISGTIVVPQNSKFARVSAYVNQNGKIYWDNFQLEIGNISSEWKPCSEDYKLYIDQSTTQISSELGDLSKIVSDNTGSDSITSAMKKKLISEYNDAIAVYNKLYNMYSVLGDESFNNLPTELNTAKNNLTTVISPLENSINEASESGLSEILNKFNIFYSLAEELTQAISNALTGLTKENQTQIEQLTSDVKIKISEITTIGDKVSELYTHFTFASNGMTIKSSQNATKTVKLDNDSLDFMDNNTVVAQITDKQLLITDAEVKNQMKVGNILIKPSGIGGIMFIYE